MIFQQKYIVAQKGLFFKRHSLFLLRKSGIYENNFFSLLKKNVMCGIIFCVILKLEMYVILYIEIMKKIFLLLCLTAAALLSAAGGASGSKKGVNITPPYLKMMFPEVLCAVPGIGTDPYFENLIDSAAPKACAFEVKFPVESREITAGHETPDKADPVFCRHRKKLEK